MRFLEREVYTFCGKRVRGAMPRARIFFVYGRAAEASGGPAADGLRAARVGSRTERHRRSDTQRCAEKGKKDVFSFSRGERSGDAFFTFWMAAAGAQLLRPWV